MIPPINQVLKLVCKPTPQDVPALQCYLRAAKDNNTARGAAKDNKHCKSQVSTNPKPLSQPLPCQKQNLSAISCNATMAVTEHSKWSHGGLLKLHFTAATTALLPAVPNTARVKGQLKLFCLHSMN